MRSLSTFTCLGFLVAAEEECYLPIDVMFLQDTTGSFEDDLPNVVSQIPNMVATILQQNPGSAFGVAEFKDKPFYPLGEPSDFCYKLNGALTTDVDQFEWDYSLLYASGGGDLPESQFQALINVASDTHVGWRNIVRESRQSTDTGAHLVILSTDATPHLPGDMAKFDGYPGGNVPQGLPSNPGATNAVTVDTLCTQYEYPDPAQMKAALEAQNIYLAILTPEDASIVPSWKWVNDDLLGQPEEFYQFIKSDSSDLIAGVLKAIEAVTAYACATTSTVAPPSTVAPSLAPTVAPTVAPAPSATPAPPVTPAGETAVATTAGEEETVSTRCKKTAAVVVKIDHRPGNLVVEYEK